MLIQEEKPGMKPPFTGLVFLDSKCRRASKRHDTVRASNLKRAVQVKSDICNSHRNHQLHTAVF
jgi:hypothetical protein